LNSRMRRIAFVAAMISASAVAAGAHAAYSGTIIRSVCPSPYLRGLITYTTGDQGWAPGTCDSTAIVNSSPTDWVYGTVTIPVETEVATSLSAKLGVRGGTTGSSQVCARTSVYDAAGNYSALGNWSCTFGTVQDKYIWPSAVTIPPEGSVAVSIQAQNGATVKNVALWWAATVN
jgi:hypothetical protein